MKRNIRKKISCSPLALKHLIYILACSIAVTISIALVQLYNEYNENMENIEDTFDMIEESYVPPVSSSVFDFNKKQLQLLLKGISILPNISSVNVVENSKNEADIIDSAGTVKNKNIIKRQYPLVYTYEGTERQVGTLQVFADTSNIYKNLKDEAIIIISSTAIEIFILAFFILAIVQILTIKPLKKIAAFVGNIDLSEARYFKRLELNRKGADKKSDELDKIVNAINNMYSRIINNYSALHDTKESLKLALDEKDILLRELYHRTKNNMQIISSLISLKTDGIENSEIDEFKKEIKLKIQTMAMVHERLYQQKHLNNIDMHAYVKDVAQLMSQSFFNSSQAVILKNKFQPVTAPIEVAIPFGLVLNEMLTMLFLSLNFSLPNDNIEISLSKKDNKTVFLEIKKTISDIEKEKIQNKIFFSNTGLVYGIVKNQLKGVLEQEVSNQHAVWSLQFSI